MKPTTLLLSCFAALFLTGCAGSRQFVPMPDQSRTVEDPAKGRIYVMRTSVYGAARTFAVAEEGKPIGRLGPKGYLCWERPPGDIVISSAVEKVSRLPMMVEAGKVYFVHLELASGMVSVNTELKPLSAEEGARVLKRCDPAAVRLDQATTAVEARKE